MRSIRRAVPFAALLLIAFGPARPQSHIKHHATRTASELKPFRLPFTSPAGPATWYLAQPYGNTVGAYFQRHDTYRYGQGIHFGVDFAAPCGTEIVAIGDGVVSEVDKLSHGALPHNLLIDHPNGYTSFYGHLLRRAQLYPGQRVTAGQVVALSGDPDETCHSRPHLHLEIRDHSHTRAYNPVTLIDADWNALALAGPSARGFERDLDDPRRWQFLDDQPDIVFSGRLLNDYDYPWPPEWGR
ncbi:MAG: M23 family metallopeptidase [Chloroflexi bacterium]|nr:M23 family metallopeptidase [Chloroflexota bacterium]